MASPYPKPTAIKQLEGSTHLNHKEPKPAPPQNLQPPAWLHDIENGLAVKIWNDQAKEFYKLGLVTVTDVESFARYCAAQAEWLRLTRDIQKEGETTTTNNGKTLIPNPKCALRQRASKEVMDWSRQFGATPAARSKIEAEPVDLESDSILAFIRPQAG
jgi:P27 family predicted phage terminase small subunit